MKKQSLFFIYLCATISSATINASEPKSPKSWANVASTPSETSSKPTTPVISQASVSQPDSSASSSIEKESFAGFWSRRPIASFLINFGHIPTYQRALTEVESFDPEKQTWQNDEKSKTFLETALRSFEGRNAPGKLNEFLNIADKKGIPLPADSLDKTKTWLRELNKELLKKDILTENEIETKRVVQGNLGMIGKIKSKAKKIQINQLP